MLFKFWKFFNRLSTTLHIFISSFQVVLRNIETHLERLILQERILFDVNGMEKVLDCVWIRTRKVQNDAVQYLMLTDWPK